ANPEVIPITPQTPQQRTPTTAFPFGNSSPDVYIVDEKISIRCPSTEVAVAATSTFNPVQQHQQQQQQILQHRTPAPDPWQPYHSPIISTQTQMPSSSPYIPQRSSFIQPQQIQQQQQQSLPSPYPTIPDPYAFDFPSTPPQEWKFQSCEDLLNEIKSEAAMFEKNREISATAMPKPIPTTILSRNNSSGSNLDQNKPQQIRGTKRRESGRTFCNGAKAIVS
uniref:Cellular-myelocytomatosis proto-oncogene n=1 Tax=Panagrolaimus sp. ES5 TaxID=591445 RepID=A0AC34GJ62_9BILA